MSDKTNEEKLRILQERLAQIKQKQNPPSTPQKPKEEAIESANLEIELPTKNTKPFYSSWISKTILVAAIAYGLFYGYNKINTDALISENDAKKIDVIEKTLEYNLDFKGNNIAITATFEDESLAKAMTNDLKIKGFQADYFYLPNKSNSTEPVYKVFIGPYENEEETNQWIENLDLEITLINIQDGSILRNIKSSSQIQMEKEKLAKEKAEKEKLAKEKLAKEKAEKEKLAEEKLAEEKLAEEKLAKEKAEKEKMQLEQTGLESESEKLKNEIEELKKTKKNLLAKRKEVTLSYTYDFTETIPDEGFLTIANNAGYPKIKQIFSNIKSQGGIENIIKNTTYTMNSNGLMIDEIFFEKNGTKVPPYKGTLTLVYY